MNEGDQVEKLLNAKIREDVETVISIHISSDSGLVSHFASELLDRAFLQEWWVYDKPKDLLALEGISSAISKINQLYTFGLTATASETLQFRLAYGPYFDSVHNEDEIPLDSDERRRVEQYIEEEGANVSLAIADFLELSNLIIDSIASTKAEIEKSPNSRKSTAKINLVGIQLVEAARFIWKKAKGNDAPAIDLNTASAFGKFLADIFDACKVEGDARSAFRAWAKETEQSE
ncbi:MAG: hypothetical protein L3J33_03735 [Rhodobacteraceae bacterium]|nr:hypothetical protein [Paracoccaceae bacterium]